MSLFVQTPRSTVALRRSGPYPRYLDVLDGASTHVQRRLQKGGVGGYESQTMAVIMALMERAGGNRVFYDVGAHVGLYSALVATVYQNAHPFAFEPTPQVAAAAMEIRRRNRLAYPVVTFAVSSAQGETSFFLSNRAETSNSLNASFRPGSKAISVRTDTLDNFIREGAPPPMVMKVDVETHEPDVLFGAAGLIRRHRPAIVCEVLRQVDEAKLERALRMLAAAGYQFYRIDARRPWPAQPASEVLRLRTARELHRDWLFSVKAPDPQFYDALERWTADIAACTADTNIVTGDASPEDGPLKIKWTWKTMDKLRDRLGAILPGLGRVEKPRASVPAAAPAPAPPAFSSAAYWESRYAAGLNSGVGSYGRLAAFKAEVLNDFVARHAVRSVVEFGSGDGAQVSLATYERYLGVDVSETAVRACVERFRDDPSKRFVQLSDYKGETAELALSLDVLYHLVEDEVFNDYMTRLFDAGTRFAIVYSSNYDGRRRSAHVRHRKFTDWVERERPDFKLVQHIPNPYPLSARGAGEASQEFSPADFHVFERVG